MNQSLINEMEKDIQIINSYLKTKDVLLIGVEYERFLPERLEIRQQ